MIIWLSSYPKSGNTWLRSFLISLLFLKNSNFELKNIRLIEQYPQKKHFKDLIKNFYNFGEIKANWISSQEKINLDNNIRFFKTHNMFCKIDEYSFSNFENTLGCIYIVRDPRNLITSLMHHNNLKNYEEAKKFIFNEKQFTIDLKSTTENFPLCTLIGSWQTHFNSWKRMKKNYLLIKYENLIANPIEEFKKVSSYIEKLFRIKIKYEDLQKSIKDVSFDKLKKMEEKYGFEESATDEITGKKKNFFNLGSNNNWKNLLEDKIAKEIEEKFNNEMKELGYI